MDEQIQWSLQTAEACPWLASDADPREGLSDWERGRLTRYVIPKRRSDWLLGRWTMKHLVRSAHHRQAGELLPLDTISIEAESGGAPFLVLPFAHSYQLSISHSGGRALCGLLVSDACGIGVDIERVSTRGEGFVRDYLSAQEFDALEARPRMDRDRHITTLWSAKEAVLKLHKIGLRVDTRRICCDVVPVCDVWTGYRVRFDAREYVAWSRHVDGFIATLVTG